MPYFMAPVLGLSILGTGVVYWLVWAKFMPLLRGYRVEVTRTAGENGAERVEFRKVWHNANFNDNGSAEVRT
jgi:hypothetical protein